MSCLNGEYLRTADLFRPDFIAKRRSLHFNTHLNTSARDQLLITPSPSMAGCTGMELRALSGRENKRDSSQKSANSWPNLCSKARLDTGLPKKWKAITTETTTGMYLWYKNYLSIHSQPASPSVIFFYFSCSFLLSRMGGLTKSFGIVHPSASLSSILPSHRHPHRCWVVPFTDYIAINKKPQQTKLQVQ